MSFDASQYLLRLKGKDYLEVKWRQAWLVADAEEKGFGFSIENECLAFTDKSANFKSTVTVFDRETGNVIRKATGHGSETSSDFGDYYEKAETKALGRALASLGYGTQFTEEDDEPLIVDSPTKVTINDPSEVVPEALASTPTPPRPKFSLPRKST